MVRPATRGLTGPAAAGVAARDGAGLAVAATSDAPVERSPPVADAVMTRATATAATTRTASATTRCARSRCGDDRTSDTWVRFGAFAVAPVPPGAGIRPPAVYRAPLP